MTTPDRKELFSVRSRGFLFVALFQLGLLSVLVPNNRNHINVDPICYMRIAQYYYQGNWDLAVSSYWSPMTSWLMVPVLAFIEDPLAASPVVTGFMAVVYLWGAAALIQAMGLSQSYGSGGALVCAVASSQWAADGLGADVLLGGLCSGAAAMMIGTRWTATMRIPALAGALYGVAYLTKSVALPWCIVLGAAFAVMHVLSGVSRSAALRSYLVTVAFAVAVSLPWIAIISINAGTFTIGTGPISAHAYAAPGIFNNEFVDNKSIDVLRRPEPGRLNDWEDADVDSYIRWNPFANFANFKHQVYVVVRNFMTIANILSQMDGLRLGLAASVFAFLLHGPWRSNMSRERWRWGLIPIATLAAFYLPLYAQPPRYFYPLFPYLVIATLGFSGVLAESAPANSRFAYRLALVVVVVSFLFPYAWRLGALIPGKVDNASAPRDLAERLQEAGLDGPVAAHHEYSFAAIYVSYFLDQPVINYDLDSHSVQRLARSGAKSLIVPRASIVFEQLTCDPCFESLDAKLYRDASQAELNPLAAFAIRADCQSDSDDRSEP
jgi:hypothetical protein